MEHVLAIMNALGIVSCVKLMTKYRCLNFNSVYAHFLKYYYYVTV